MKTISITIPTRVRRLGRTYAEALLEACELGKEGADPVELITDTDAFPKTVKKIPECEFLVGWFHGVGDAYGFQAAKLWEELAPEPKAPRGATKRRRRA